MDKELIKKYRQEMLNTYNMVKPVALTIENKQMPSSNENTGSPTGQLIAIVTTIRSIYPVEGAKITVFTGTVDRKNIISTALTDQSGRTEPFILPTPPSQLSLDSQNTKIPYAIYNMLIQAEGYVDTIHLNILVFSGVTSLQRTQLLLLETAGEDASVRIFDQTQQYNL